MHEAGQPAWVTYVVPIVIIVAIGLRLLSARRARRLRLETLAIVPAVYFLVFVGSLWESPPVGLINWLEIVLAVAVGAGLGWQRGKMMRITIDPETHALNQQSSPAALIFIILLMVARRGLMYEGAAMGLNVPHMIGLLIAFVFGLLAATRAEMFLRARRMLTEARAV
jgi:hypothetical protein